MLLWDSCPAHRGATSIRSSPNTPDITGLEVTALRCVCASTRSAGSYCTLKTPPSELPTAAPAPSSAVSAAAVRLHLSAGSFAGATHCCLRGRCVGATRRRRCPLTRRRPHSRCSLRRLLPACQRADWPEHKLECAELKAEADANRVPEQQVYGPRGRQGSRRSAAAAPGAAAAPAAGEGAGSPAAAAAAGERAADAATAAAVGDDAPAGAAAAAPRLVRPMCGLCGGRVPPFEITDCCGRVVCSDHDNYVLMR